MDDNLTEGTHEPSLAERVQARIDYAQQVTDEYALDVVHCTPPVHRVLYRSMMQTPPAVWREYADAGFTPSEAYAAWRRGVIAPARQVTG